MTSVVASPERSVALLRAIVVLGPDRVSRPGRRLRVAAALFVCQRVDVGVLLERGSDG